MKKIERIFKGESCHLCSLQDAVSHAHQILEPTNRADAISFPAQSVFFPRFIRTENYHSHQLTASSDIAAANLQQLAEYVYAPFSTERKGRI